MQVLIISLFINSLFVHIENYDETKQGIDIQYTLQYKKI